MEARHARRREEAVHFGGDCASRMKRSQSSDETQESFMARGECNCGAIPFAIDVPLADVYAWHCAICRRATGSNGTAEVLVPNEQFRWLHGDRHVTLWAKLESSWEIWFYRIFASPVPPKNNPHTMFV